MNRDAVEEWIHGHVSPSGEIEIAHERPWSTVLRVPVGAGVVWFKECNAVQGFEPRLTAELFARWPDLAPRVFAYDEERRWLLLADAGTCIGALGNPPELWMEVLPAYAEFQRGEAEHSRAHLAHGVPDLRVVTLPARFAAMVSEDLPLESEEVARLRQYAVPFLEACAELATTGVPETIQHDDLHMNNVYVLDRRLRVLDWGDSSISHPFMSLIATFRFLEERNGLSPDDPWFARLRDAYLEPWGSGLTETFELALRVGAFAHAIAELRQRESLAGRGRKDFDIDLAARLRRALRGV